MSANDASDFRPFKVKPCDFLPQRDESEHLGLLHEALKHDQGLVEGEQNANVSGDDWLSVPGTETSSG